MINELHTNTTKYFVVSSRETPLIIFAIETIIIGGTTAAKTEKKVTIATDKNGMPKVSKAPTIPIGIDITLNKFFCKRLPFEPFSFSLVCNPAIIKTAIKTTSIKTDVLVETDVKR